MSNKKTVRDISFSGKRVLMRVDFNVPMKEKDARWSSTTSRGSRKPSRR